MTDLNNIRLVLDFLNRKTGGQFFATHPKGGGQTKHARLVGAILNKGYTVQECKCVIARKDREWQGTKLKKYIRPATLFGPDNFDKYLAECSK